MTRRYDEPVEVRRRDEDPAEFLWRGRFYAVRAVLARWVETGAWWQVSGAAVPAVATMAAVPAGPAVDGTSALATSAAGPGAGEREVWRVEASAGRAQGAGVYELCLDWTSGGWSLLRTQD